MTLNEFVEMSELTSNPIIYLDIIYNSNPAIPPNRDYGWEVVETMLVPKAKYDALETYSLSSECNKWFIDHISEVFGRDYKYVGANNSVFFNNLVVGKNDELIEDDVVQFSYRKAIRLKKDLKLFLVGKSHEAYSWHYFKS